MVNETNFEIHQKPLVFQCFLVARSYGTAYYDATLESVDVDPGSGLELGAENAVTESPP